MESFSVTSSGYSTIFEPILPDSNPSMNFTIHLHYNHLTITSTPDDPENLIFNYTTPIDDDFVTPCEILCNYNEHTIIDSSRKTYFMHDIFCGVPDYILHDVLRQMGDCARRIVALNTEGGMMHMNVLLRIVTSRIVEEDQIDVNYSGRQNMGISPKLDVETTSSNFTDQCSICMEEFHNGSHSELFYTRCSHIFHKDCIAKWIHRCVSNSSSNSCPLCRLEIL